MDSSITPQVTVVLPVYNAAAFLHEAIAGVLAQSYGDFEFLIIDDGSTDESARIISELSDVRIRRITHNTNQGLIATLNEGLQEARGTYIARIDADDIWHDAYKLERQITFLQQHSEYALVGTDAIIINESGTQQGVRRVPHSDTAIRRQLLVKNPFMHPSVVFVKQSALDAGGFHPTDLHAEDYGLWLRIARNHKVANIDDALMSYRITATGVTRKHQVVQTKASFALVQQFKNTYPMYWLAWLKWVTKLLVLQLRS